MLYDIEHKNKSKKKESNRNKIDVLFQKFIDRKYNCVETYISYQGPIKKPEIIDQYVFDLRIISKNCRFDTLDDEMLRDTIVCGVHSDKMQERNFRNNELTLIKALSICRGNDEAQSRIKDLQQEEQEYCQV